MTTVKRITDLTRYTSVLPYASEMFGVYQPLLGWRSRRIQARYAEGFDTERPLLIDRLKRQFAGLVDITYAETGQISIDISPGVLEGGRLRRFDSVVLEKVAAGLPPYHRYEPSIWSKIITAGSIGAILTKDVVAFYTSSYAEMRKADSTGFASLARTESADRPRSRLAEIGAFEHQLQYESAVAGALLFLVAERRFDALKEIFYASRDTVEQAQALVRMIAAEDGVDAYLDLETLDPTDQAQLRNVALSPIGVVHLFRQYFFELDTFLGPPERHVWLSPGSTVELIEVHTRRTMVEKTLETTLDILTKAEKTTTQRDEISEAVQEDNSQDIKFGASVTASYASIEAASSFDYGTSQRRARETAHKRMREQTERLSSQIRKNLTSTFKTVTEVTDVSSTRHVLANTTDELVNYELRRKMRQVGVQVQDIGTFLCWQTYVDDPGRELGLGRLVHIAAPPELGGIPHPEEIPTLQPFQTEQIVTIPFISVEGTNADNEGEVYVDGVEADDSEFMGSLEKIQADFPQEFVSPKANFELANVEFDPQGKPVSVSRTTAIVNSGDRATFVLHLESADFQGQNSLQVKLILHWHPRPGANDAIIQKNNDNIASFKAQEKAAYEAAFIETVKDRVTLASKIVSRDGAELREEERIVVYRKLVQDMLMNGVPVPDDRTRHVVAELINSIFDVEKMLYFVAPEWWRPQPHRSRQQLPGAPDRVFDPTLVTAATTTGTVLRKGLLNRIRTGVLNATSPVMSSSTVGWGGVDDVNRDNYYITEDSDPARLGSSLGWLLQLDGDNMRNAFLNAPWVKAVIPIRPGREKAAINWLKGVEGMNGITDDVIYHAASPDEKDVDGNPLDGQKMIDVLMDLAEKIRRKHDQSVATDSFPKAEEVSDPDLVDEENTVTSTPVDRVYEHGFFPLERSFRANVGKNYEIYDQWLEILPTDQTVPVPVAYDPKTGRQV